MKILVLNCGSSSVKYKLFDIDSKSVLAQGGAGKNRIGRFFLETNFAQRRKSNFENQYAGTPFGYSKHTECTHR